MALTVPTIPVGVTQCNVTVSSVDGNVMIPITLTQGQMDDWSDDDLTQRLAALKTAVEAFLPAGVDIRTQVVWMQQGFDTTVNTAEQVH